MDNEGLLAWGEYEVERAREVLERAIAHTCVLRETVRIEKENKQQMTDCGAYLEKLGVPAIVYKMATSLEELLVMISDKKAFLKRNGYSEEDLEP
jgi:hypothetical protein